MTCCTTSNTLDGLLCKRCILNKQVGKMLISGLQRSRCPFQTSCFFLFPVFMLSLTNCLLQNGISLLVQPFSVFSEIFPTGKYVRVNVYSTAGEGPSCVPQVMPEGADSPGKRETGKWKHWDESREKAEDHGGQRKGHRGERKGEERCLHTTPSRSESVVHVEFKWTSPDSRRDKHVAIPRNFFTGLQLVAIFIQ